MTYSRGMLFSSLCANICTFPQKLNLTHVMQEQKCLFSGSLKQTDVSNICQQVMRKLLPLRDITTYAPLLRGKPRFCGKYSSTLWGGDGKDLWRYSSPTPLLKQGQTQQGALGCVQWCSETLQWWKLHAHLGATRYRFWSPSYWKNHVVFKLYFLNFNLCSIEKSGSAPFTLHHLILIQAGKISLQPSFLQFGQLSLPLPMCQILLPLNNLCSPSLGWLQHRQPLPALGAQIWTQILDVSQQHGAEDKNPCPAWWPCSSCCPGCCWPFLQRHRAGSWSSCHPPTAPCPSVSPLSFG